MEILEAYCHDLGRVVEIYEAQEEYFAQPSGRRHRFEFRCSDPTCRAEKNPLVVGVNYDKNAEDSEKYQQPHFKSHSNHPHIDTCMWAVAEAIRRKELLGGDERDIYHPRPKATNVVDVFSPRDADTLLPAIAAADHASPAFPGDAKTKDGGQARNRTGVSATSLLEKFVDCWSNLDVEQRRNHHIVIEGRSLTYRQAILRVNLLTEEENGTRVVYGGAHVKAWPTADPTHYYVNFMDECERFPGAAGERSLTISLPMARLRQSRRGSLLMDRIEQASQPDHYLQVFAWGNITARTKGKGYEMNVAALDNLVLKARSRKKPNVS
jgi:hypothetical protein